MINPVKIQLFPTYASLGRIGECGRTFIMSTHMHIETVSVYACETYDASYREKKVAGELPECAKCILDTCQELLQAVPGNEGEFNARNTNS